MDEGHTYHSVCSLVSYHTPACLDRWDCLSFGGPNRHAGQANGPTFAPVSLCVPSLGSGQPTPRPKESRPNFGGFPRPWTTDERKAGERRGVASAPSPATNARSAGIFTGVNQGVVNSKILPQGWRDSPYP